MGGEHGAMNEHGELGVVSSEHRLSCYRSFCIDPRFDSALRRRILSSDDSNYDDIDLDDGVG